MIEEPYRARRDATSSERVGVWRRAGADGEWIRDPSRRDEWRHWADVDALPARRPGVARVVWVGESLARGFLFDPEHRPAVWLERALETAAGAPVEVIDLGSNDLRAGGLVRLIERLPLLDPDAIVLLAGNNWHGVDGLTAAAADDAFRMLRDEGEAAAAAWWRDAYLPVVASEILGRLARVARACRNAHVVVTIPAYNLRHWRPIAAHLAPPDVGPARGRWHRLETIAEGRRGAGDAGRRERALGRMFALDSGEAARTHAVAAEALVARGRYGAARSALERARDATRTPFVPFLPGCASSVEGRLRSECASHGFDVVDLPERFAETAPDGIAGREHFLDYCHPNEAGTAILVADAARRLAVRLFGGSGAPDVSHFGPSTATRGAAHFLAAVQNARYDQPYETLLFHCRAAADLSDETARHMRWYARRWASPAPLWATRGAEAFLGVALFRRHLLSADPSLGAQACEAPLARAIAEVLGDELAAPRARRDDVDLLDPRWCRRSADEALPGERAAVRAFYRARSRDTSFLLPRVDRPSRLVLTFRFPAGAPAGARLRLRVDAALVAELRGEARWTTHRVELPGSSDGGALRSVTLTWPAARTTGSEPASVGTEAEACGRWYGDLFDFRAVPARGLSPDAPEGSGASEGR